MRKDYAELISETIMRAATEASRDKSRIIDIRHIVKAIAFQAQVADALLRAEVHEDRQDEGSTLPKNATATQGEIVLSLRDADVKSTSERLTRLLSDASSSPHTGRAAVLLDLLDRVAETAPAEVNSALAELSMDLASLRRAIEKLR